MDSGVETVSAVQERDGVGERFAGWVLLDGHRLVVAGCLAVAVVGLVWLLIENGFIVVGPDSVAATIFASGLTSGILTLMTIALSINQLVLSRVFGSPDSLRDRLDGSRELRRRVEQLADRPSSPSDPAAFLSLVATTLSDRASTLLALRESPNWEPTDDVTSALEDIVAYGHSIDAHVEADTQVADVLGTILGPEYATNMTAVSHLQSAHAASLSEQALTEFRAIEELLESVAVVRQFYKTIALQQDFADLSRLIVFSGLIALLSTIALALVYRTNSTTLPPSLLPVVVSLSVGVIIFPLAVFVAYVLRAATVARQTVSVGPFIPPGKR